ncbi:MAG: GIY-YIG nuclease family protein [Arcicella sp.]|nr:GIY-YIG nuclease family protein [Arcicella sp.]
MKQHNYFVYIVTNPRKTVLYTGVTNNLQVRMQQHFENRGNPKIFAGKYYCYNLLHFEYYQYIQHAIEREKEIKLMMRDKKEALINEHNPDWNFIIP